MSKKLSSVLEQGDQTPVVLTVEGSQEFMDKEIPIIVGGFGDDNRVMTDKTISEIHGMNVTDVRRRITDNAKRFKDNIDFIDLLNCYAPNAQQLLAQFGYSKMQISKAEHIYILSERGYSKLIKIMDTDLAWEIHDKLIDDYFTLRETVSKQFDISKYSAEMQAILIHDEKIIKVEHRVDVLEDNIHITRSQQKQLKQFANKIIVSALGGRYSNAYKLFAKKTFSVFWHDFYNHFNIASYLDTPKLKFQEALQFVNDWKPNNELSYMIKGANLGGQADE